MRGPKTDPEAPHNRAIRGWGDEVVAAGGKVIAGGGREKEQLVNTEGGHKNGRRPDIIFQPEGGEVQYGNVGRTTASGAPVPREQKALEDLRGTGVPTDFRAYDQPKPSDAKE